MAKYILILIFSVSLAAQADESTQDVFWTQNRIIGAGILGSYYFISRMDDGPIIFGSLYAVGSLFNLHYNFQDDNSKIENFVMPFGLLSMSLINFAVFHDEDSYSDDEVLLYNLGGTALLLLWDYTFENHIMSRRFSSRVRFWPELARDQMGLRLSVEI